MFLDPSLGLLWICAFACLWYGAVRSHQFLKEEKDPEVKEATFVQSKLVIILPIVGSVVLLLLFYFLDFSITVKILYGFIALVVVSSQCFIFGPLVDFIAKKISPEPKGFTLPKIGFVPISGLFLFAYSVGVVVAWILTGHWLIVDGIAICLAVTQMSLLRLPSMKIATFLLVPFLVYDVFWVFISPFLSFFHGESVMVSVAVRLPPLPLVLKMPRFSDPGYYSILGLGDIVLPGLFIVFLYSLDKFLDREEKVVLKNLKESYLSYFTLSLLEYSLGYLVTIISGRLMKSGQPALLYLVPFTLGLTALIAWWRGDLGVLWRGVATKKEEKGKETEMHGLLEEGQNDETREEENTENTESISISVDSAVITAR